LVPNILDNLIIKCTIIIDTSHYNNTTLKTSNVNIIDKHEKKITKKSVLVEENTTVQNSKIEHEIIINSNEDKAIKKFNDFILAKEFFINHLTENITDVIFINTL